MVFLTAHYSKHLGSYILSHICKYMEPTFSERLLMLGFAIRQVK
jgi:hypothetical protein